MSPFLHAAPPQAKEPSQKSQAKKLPPSRPPARRAGVLRFSPTAWAKLLFFRDRGGTEIGGFGITPPDDLLYIQDFRTVRQEVSRETVSFDDEAVADFFEACVDEGLRPQQFGRIWCHSHPGNNPQPSGTDEETFARVFAGCQHAVMFIIARDDKTFARLHFGVGPGGDLLLPVEVDHTRPFWASNQDAWEKEYLANVQPDHLAWEPAFGFDEWDLTEPRTGPVTHVPDRRDKACVPHDWLAELEQMTPAERE